MFQNLQKYTHHHYNNTHSDNNNPNNNTLFGKITEKKGKPTQTLDAHQINPFKKGNQDSRQSKNIESMSFPNETKGERINSTNQFCQSNVYCNPPQNNNNAQISNLCTPQIKVNQNYSILPNQFNNQTPKQTTKLEPNQMFNQAKSTNQSNVKNGVEIGINSLGVNYEMHNGFVQRKAEMPVINFGGHLGLGQAIVIPDCNCKNRLNKERQNIIKQQQIKQRQEQLMWKKLTNFNNKPLINQNHNKSKITVIQKIHPKNKHKLPSNNLFQSTLDKRKPVRVFDSILDPITLKVFYRSEEYNFKINIGKKSGQDKKKDVRDFLKYKGFEGQVNLIQQQDSIIARINEQYNQSCYISTQQRTRSNLYVYPSRKQIKSNKMIAIDLRIGNQNGQILWLGQSLIQDIQFQNYIQINQNSVEVYPDFKHKPPIGMHLNKQCIVTFKRCEWLQKLKKSSKIKDSKSLQVGMREWLLKISDACELLDLDQQKGQWRVKIKHF